MIIDSTTRHALKTLAQNEKVKHKSELLQLVLRQLAPNKIKETIPTIQIGKSRDSETGEDGSRIVALPTLGLVRADFARWIEWQVRYKMVDPRLMKGLRPIKFMPWNAEPGSAWVFMDYVGLFAYRRESSIARKLGLVKPELHQAANRRLEGWKAVDVDEEMKKWEATRAVSLEKERPKFRKIKLSFGEKQPPGSSVIPVGINTKRYRGQLVANDKKKAKERVHIRKADYKNYIRYSGLHRDAAESFQSQRREA